MQSKKPAKKKFTTQQQQQQQQLLDDFYAELYGGLFEQGTSGFEAEAEGDDMMMMMMMMMIFVPCFLMTVQIKRCLKKRKLLRTET